MERVQAVKKLNSILRERLNFRRQPILCTTLYRNPILYKRATLVAHLTNFSLEFFMQFSYKMPLYCFCTMVQKKSKMTKNSNQGGGGVQMRPFLSLYWWQKRSSDGETILINMPKLPVNLQKKMKRVLTARWQHSEHRWAGRFPSRPNSQQVDEQPPWPYHSRSFLSNREKGGNKVFANTIENKAA